MTTYTLFYFIIYYFISVQYFSSTNLGSKSIFHAKGHEQHGFEQGHAF